MAKSLAAAVVFLALSPIGSIAADSVFNVPALTATPLNPRTLKHNEQNGIVTEEVRFHSETDGDKDVDIFAYFSFPAGARGLPAYIWNPGGLGQASRAYTEAGATHGYATLCIDFPQPGYRSTGSYPINTYLELGDDPHQAPIYHGAVALLKAVSYLESRLEVDKNRIGMAGASWGGFFTTLMVGVDPRLKVGSALYGCGSLQLGNAWWDGGSRNGRKSPTPAQRERWRTVLDPAWRLPNVKTPIAWFTGTNDRFYLMPALMKSYAMAGGEKHLSLSANWDHALPPRLHDGPVTAWLDAHLQGKPGFPTVTPLSVKNVGGKPAAEWTFEGNAVAADLIVSYGADGNWAGRYWHTFKADIDGKTCRTAFPSAAVPCFLSGSVIDTNGFRTSTPLLEVDSAALGLRASPAIPDFDGCAEWGGFEDGQIAWLTRHDRSGQTRWIPQRSTDAKQGKHSAILKPGITVLPPILSTAGLPHVFSCFLKASEQNVPEGSHTASPAPAGAINVTIQLGDVHKTANVGSDWIPIVLEYTPSNTVMGLFPATITVPAGATVLIDAVGFHPLSRDDHTAGR